MHYGAGQLKTGTYLIVITGLRALGIHFEVRHWSSCVASLLQLRDATQIVRSRRLSQQMALDNLSAASDLCRAFRGRTLLPLANRYLNPCKSFFNPIAHRINGPPVFEISSFKLSSTSIVVTKLRVN